MGAFRKLTSGRAINMDFGLLIIRLGIGLSMMILHGYGKITGGPELWKMLGSNMESFGVSFAPAFWGFLAAFAEFGGSILLILGALFRPAAAMLAFTMLVAVMRHLGLPADDPGSGWQGASHALELLVVYLGLLLSGSGRYALPLARVS